MENVNIDARKRILPNSYYSIACNEFWYLRDAVSPVYCNPASASAQQIEEKMLKSVAELVCTGIEKLMTSHNLRALYDEIRKVDSSIQLDRRYLVLFTPLYNFFIKNIVQELSDV